MEKPRVIGHVVSVNGFRLKVELSQEAKSPSRATPDGVQRAVAINAFLTFDLGAGTHAIGVLSDLDARETFDPVKDDELSLELTKPRRIASVQLLGTVKRSTQNQWKFDVGITVLPTLDTPAEVAHPDVLSGIFEFPPERNRPLNNPNDHKFDIPLELGHQSGNENVVIKASFNDLFSRPLAIVGNTGSGKSYTVASLLRNVIENDSFSDAKSDPHIFILDINGEYANAILPEEEREYHKEPNKAYINGKEAAVPIWLMNSEEICSWLSASEQTQQPVLKAWWSLLKGSSVSAHESGLAIYDEALAIINQMYPMSTLRKNNARNLLRSLQDFLQSTAVNVDNLTALLSNCLGTTNTGEDINYYGEIITNPTAVDAELKTLYTAIEANIPQKQSSEHSAKSGDTPTAFPYSSLTNTGNMAAAASQEEASQINQHLTTLRMRLKARLSDKRWSIFTNYENLGISSISEWFQRLGFEQRSHKITVIDLSMLSHEVLPYVCAIIGRVFIEAREMLGTENRHLNPWVLVLEEAHNYARPPRNIEDHGQSLSRRAFERIAKEGRKFGLSLIVASQRPSEISPTIISQCANFFSHRLQNPDDIDHFRRIIPKQAQRLLDQVTVLTSGEAIVFGSATHVPVRVRINLPSCEPSSFTATPFVDWTEDKLFPLKEVVSNWGVSFEQANDTAIGIDEEE